MMGRKNFRQLQERNDVKIEMQTEGIVAYKTRKGIKLYYVLTSFLSIWTLYGYNISMGHH